MIVHLFTCSPFLQTFNICLQHKCTAGGRIGGDTYTAGAAEAAPYLVQDQPPMQRAAPYSTSKFFIKTKHEKNDIMYYIEEEQRKYPTTKVLLFIIIYCSMCLRCHSEIHQ